MKLLALLCALAAQSVAARAGLGGASRILTPFQQRRALKVISGLMNFDRESVARVCKAAAAGGATFVDIACDPELVQMVRAQSDIPICVSAVEAHRFPAAVEAGADMVEVGNYDYFYTQGIEFSADEVLSITRETMALVPGVPISVTVPHKLPLDQQVALAEELVGMGVPIIQTEGGTSSRPVGAGVLGMIEKASPSLAATYEISRCVGDQAFVMSASGITDVTAPLAIASGAAGIGVGSAINKLDDEVAMTIAVRRLVEALGAPVGDRAAQLSA
mmetsp:Transcript_6999/g.17921  ORF Transcript_6999/g.17921 Transcript_6999/m.17921 type:complete len:275 (-) Transcript_6999:346-1170(-)